MSANRRAFARHEIKLAAEATLADGQIVSGVTKDLSLGGSCVACAHPLPESETVQLALFVVVDGIEEASVPPLLVRASVQWTAQNDDASLEDRHLAGLRFDGMTEAQGQWLARFLPAH